MIQGRHDRVRRLATLATATGMMLLVFGGEATRAAAHTATANARACDRRCQQDLATARAATDKYHDPAVALADGFVPVTDCDGSRDGAVGIHFYNDRNGRSVDDREWISKPELLIYLPDRRADDPLSLRLVAIEYFVDVYQDGRPYNHSFASPVDPDPADQPVLFGHRFEGPMAHRPYPTLWHYDLHVWAWARNPKGTFAHYNPALRCPAGTTVPVPELRESLSMLPLRLMTLLSRAERR